MRLLILTQKVDKNDPILGFFHRWVEEFAKNCEVVIVICLEKGEYHLPENVQVFSLGKERGISRFKYVRNFYKYIIKEKENYDSVFVHMNQEYVILGGLLWKFWQKKIYLWRNHAYGNLVTDIAITLSDKVFFTSSRSYTARSKKAVKMPAGIDTDFFKPNDKMRKSKTILFLGRISPVKRVLEFIELLKGQNFSYATIVGNALPKDLEYEKLVREKVFQYDLDDRVKFVGAVSKEEALKLYQSHERYVNMTLAGSLDKTILEAASCGTQVMVENPDLKHLETMTEAELRNYVVKEHSLKKLIAILQKELNNV
jgi:glycosyltransferase involved in cell wall biosynthesis